MMSEHDSLEQPSPLRYVLSIATANVGQPQPPATGLVPVYVREWFTAPQPPIDVNPDVEHICAKAYIAADVEVVLNKLTKKAEAFPELNPSNYDVDDVSQLNEWGIEMVKLLAQLRGGGA